MIRGLIKGQVTTMISGYEAHVASISTLQTLMKELWVVCGFNIKSFFEKGCSKQMHAIKLKGTLGNDKFNLYLTPTFQVNARKCCDKP